MVFSKVTAVDMGEIVAQVDRTTSELRINPVIWQYLPQEYREFVLLHEEGHLVLMTADEFEANKYAAWKYLKDGTLTEAETGRRIMVISNIMGAQGDEYFKRDPEVSNTIVELIAGAASGIVSVLPALGIGSKARMKEQQAAAQAQMEVINASAKAAESSQKIYLIIGLFAVTAIVLIFALRK